MPPPVGLSAGLYIPGGHPLLLSQEQPAPRLFDTQWDEAYAVENRLEWFKSAQRAALVAAGSTDAAVLHATTLLDEAGSAWLIMGERSSGKSALAAAWWKLAGRVVFADDYAVIREDVVLVGPRVLPVRPNTARLLDLDINQSCVDLPHDVPASATLAGAIWIRTGPTERIDRLDHVHARYEASRRTMGQTTAEAAWLPIRSLRHIRLTWPFSSQYLEPSLEALLKLIH